MCCGHLSISAEFRCRCAPGATPRPNPQRKRHNAHRAGCHTQHSRLGSLQRRGFALSREAGTASGGAHGIEAKIEVRAKARSVAQCCVRSAADRLRERSIARGNAERSRGSLFDKCRARRRGRRQLLGAGILRQSRRRAAAGRLFNYVDLLSHHCLRQRRRRRWRASAKSAIIPVGMSATPNRERPRHRRPRFRLSERTRLRRRCSAARPSLEYWPRTAT